MTEAEPPAASSMSFERAEFESPAAPALACAFCRKSIANQYWQISKRPACAECRLRLQQELASANSKSRFLRAFGLGSLAAIAGCVAWVIVVSVTKSQWGIVAIGIGYLVGKAVRKGAGGLGGTRYQVMAMVLTYCAIAFANLPLILHELAKSADHASSAAAAPVGIGGLLEGCLAILGLALVSPFLGGAEHFMGWIIIGIGLYEAWKFTRGVPVQVLGPFAIQAAGVPRAAAPDASD